MILVFIQTLNFTVLKRNKKKKRKVLGIAATFTTKFITALDFTVDQIQFCYRKRYTWTVSDEFCPKASVNN